MRAATRLVRLVALVVTMPALLGCASAVGSTLRVDGWPIGPATDGAALERAQAGPSAQRPTVLPWSGRRLARGDIDAPGCARIIEAARSVEEAEDLPLTSSTPTIFAMDLVDESNRAVWGAGSGSVGDYVVIVNGRGADRRRGRRRRGYRTRHLRHLARATLVMP